MVKKSQLCPLTMIGRETGIPMQCDSDCALYDSDRQWCTLWDIGGAFSEIGRVVEKLEDIAKALSER